MLFGDDRGRPVVVSVWTEEMIRVCLHLYLAILPSSQKLLSYLAEVYTDANGDIKRTILRTLETPIREIGMESPELLKLVENCTKESDILVTRIIHILTERQSPTPELVNRVRNLYAKRSADVRFLIPVLNGLTKQEIYAALPKLIKLNPGVVGYYRVNYDTESLSKLCDAVASKALSPVDRLNVLDDLFSLIAAGKANTVEGLRLLKAYKQEESYIVWNNLSQQLAKLSVILADQEYYDDWVRFKLDLLSGIKQSVSWEAEAGEDHLTTLLRSLILSELGTTGDEEIRLEAKRRFDQHASGKTQISPDIRAAVYRIVASMGKEEDYNTMVTMFNQAELQEEKTRILR